MRWLWLFSLTILMLQGCATTNNSARNVDSLKFSEAHPSIALMPLDVQLSKLDASGLTEPKAEWTASAKHYMHDEFKEFVHSHGIKMSDGTQLEDDNLMGLLALHAAVGNEILLHHYAVQLPTKGTALDWTLGDEASALREKLHADYGLFIYVRDSYSSGGRVALQIFAALAGVGVQGGVQAGFASLVDLRSGKVIWFNRLLRTTGDLRQEQPARETFDALMAGFPAI